VIHKRLLARIPKPRTYKVGICANDIARIPVTPDFIADLLECLGSVEPLDLKFGFFIAECALKNPLFVKAARNAREQIAALARQAVSHPDRQVQSSALQTVVAYRTFCSDYRNLMLGQIASGNAACQRVALAAAPTFLEKQDLALLMPFRTHPEYGETGGMGGPLRYTTRDLALQVAELIAGRRFPDGDCSETVNDSTVSWRGWSTFIRWINRPRLWRMFGG
jgi:hypothetical protein